MVWKKPKRKSQLRSAAGWKRKIEEHNWENWQEKENRKSTLEWYETVKEENGPETSWEGHVALQWQYR